MKGDVINEDGTPVLIEAVYWRYHGVYVDGGFDSPRDAQAMLFYGWAAGELAAVGVFIDGEPHSVFGNGDGEDEPDGYFVAAGSGKAWQRISLDDLRAEYAKAKEQDAARKRRGQPADTQRQIGSKPGDPDD